MSDENTAVSYIYCNSRDADKSNSTILIGTILKQLCLQQNKLPTLLEALHDRLEKERSKIPSWNELADLILPTVSKFKQTFIVVDGLDECEESEKLSRLLLDLVESTAIRLKIYVSSRSESRQTRLFRNFPSIVITSGTTDDLILFVKSEIEDQIKNDKLLLSDARLKYEIVASLVSKADGMYVLYTISSFVFWNAVSCC